MREECCVENLIFNINGESDDEYLEILNVEDESLYRMLLIFDNAILTRPRACVDINRVCIRYLNNRNIGGELYEKIREWIEKLYPSTRSVHNCWEEEDVDILDEWKIKEKDRILCKTILSDNLDDYIKLLEDRIVEEDDIICIDGGLLWNGKERNNDFIIYDGISQLAFAALCGSVNIFNYVYECGSEMDKNVVKCGLVSGNDDIIDDVKNFVEDDDVEELFSLCMKFYRNEECMWLYNNYNIRKVDVSVYSSISNSEMMNFMICNDLVYPPDCLRGMSENCIKEMFSHSVCNDIFMYKYDIYKRHDMVGYDFESIVLFEDGCNILNSILEDSLYLRYIMEKYDVVRDFIVDWMIARPLDFIKRGDLMDVMCCYINMNEIKFDGIDIINYAALHKSIYTIDVLCSHGYSIDTPDLDKYSIIPVGDETESIALVEYLCYKDRTPTNNLSHQLETLLSILNYQTQNN